MDYKILITGSEGQLGEYLTLYLSNFFKVIGTSRNGSLQNNIEKLDITDYLSVRKVILKFKPNVIINTAAITNVDYCDMNKKEANDVNVVGLKNLISASSKSAKIVHFSSDYIFDGAKGYYNETSLPNPLNYYGRTKLESENLLIGSNRKYLIIRISTLYSYNGNNIFTWIYRNLLNNKPINAISDQLTNPSYIPYLAKALVDMIILNGVGIYNYGSSDAISKYDFSLLVSRKFKLNKSLINNIKSYECDYQLAKRPINSSFNIDKIIKTFDISLPSTNQCMDDIKINNYA